MQRKRSKRSRIRAAKRTSGHGHKKKNRGAGNRGGRGKAGAGKRGDAKLMKVTKGKRNMGKHGFTSLKEPDTVINVAYLQEKLDSLLNEGKIEKAKDVYKVDLNALGYDKLLSKGPVRFKMEITVDKASPNAVKKIEAAGGSVTVQEK